MTSRPDARECPTCEGMMVDLVNMPEGDRGPGPCRTCDGNGYVWRCPECQGEPEDCKTCFGDGIISEPARIELEGWDR
jgi:DnaJ-class molecular chaperone